MVFSSINKIIIFCGLDHHGGSSSAPFSNTVMYHVLMLGTDGDFESKQLLIRRKQCSSSKSVSVPQLNQQKLRDGLS